jgi:hypothetical protein
MIALSYALTRDPALSVALGLAFYRLAYLAWGAAS